MDNFNSLYNFIAIQCPTPDRWCSGEMIPKNGRKYESKSKRPCSYYNPRKGCTHPGNPKNLTKDNVKF